MHPGEVRFGDLAVAALLLCALSVGCSKFPGRTSAPAKDGEGGSETPATAGPADDTKDGGRAKDAAPGAKPRPAPQPKPLPVPVETGPDGLDDVLSRAKELERETRFSEALKLCRGARKTYARHPRVKELKRLMARLMEERKLALNMPFAVEKLGSVRPAEVMIAKDALAGAGEVGRLFLRKAVRDREGPIAAEAAKLLAEVRDGEAAAFMLARFQNDPKEPPRSALLASMKRLFVAGRGLDVLPELDGLVKGDTEYAFRDVASVLCKAYEKTAERDAAKYGELVGDPGGYARLKAYLERAMISGDADIAAWALGHAALAGLVPAAGLVVWYKLDGDAQDSSGNGYHGAISGTPTWKDGTVGTGSVGCRAGYIQLPDIRSKFTDEGTLSLWLKMDSPRGFYESPFHFGTSGVTHYIRATGEFYAKAFRDDLLAVWMHPPGGVPDRTKWHHMAITNKPGAGNWKVYLNGAEVYSNTGEAAISLPANCRIGHGGSGYAKGDLDDVRVYNRALTPEEVGLFLIYVAK